MRYALSIAQAARLESLKTIKPDAARPTLGVVEMTFGDDIVTEASSIKVKEGLPPLEVPATVMLTAACTDTYRLVRWDMEVIVEVDDADAGRGGTFVPSIEVLSKALEVLRKAAPRATKGHWIVLEVVSGEYGHDSFEVSGSWDDSPVFTVPAWMDADYPKWRVFFNGYDFHSEEAHVFKADVPSETSVLITLPAFNPKYVSDIPRFFGPTVSLQGDMGPIRLGHTLGTDDEGETRLFEEKVERMVGVPDRKYIEPFDTALKPWVFTSKAMRAQGDSQDTFTYLLMPVRV